MTTTFFVTTCPGGVVDFLAGGDHPAATAHRATKLGAMSGGLLDSDVSSEFIPSGSASFNDDGGQSSSSKSVHRAAVWRTAGTMSSAALFGVGIWAVKGQRSAFEFAAGYLVEQSLSVDNLFVFIMLFSYFKVQFFCLV